MFNTAQNRFQLQKMFLVKDTVDDSSSLDVSLLADMQLDKLAEAAGVVVVHGLGVPEGLHDGTAGQRRRKTVNGRGRTIGKVRRLSEPTCSAIAPPPHGTFCLGTTPPASAGSCTTGTSGSAWCSPFYRRRSRHWGATKQAVREKANPSNPSKRSECLK